MSTLGLSNLSKGGHKITVTKNGKILIKGVVIKSESDAMLAVQKNGTLKNMGKEEGLKRIK